MIEAARILCLAPHPDDEVLGCGGTLALAAARGARVHVAVVFDELQGLAPLHVARKVVAGGLGVGRHAAGAAAIREDVPRQHNRMDGTRVLGAQAELAGCRLRGWFRAFSIFLSTVRFFALLSQPCVFNLLF